MSKRALSERALIGLLAAITGSALVAVNIYLPVVPLVRAEFGVSVAAANTTVSAPLVVFAVGLLVWGPLSDHYGRRPVLLVGLAVNALGSLLALVAPSIGFVTFARLVQAIGSSAGVTVARATIGDLFRGERMAKMIALLTMVMLLANSLAPTAGGAIAAIASWRAIFAVLAAIAIATWIAAFRLLPESRTGVPARRPQQMLDDALVLVRSPQFAALALIGGLLFAEFYVFVALMPYVFKTVLHRTMTEYGLWYLWISVGYFAGNWYVSHYAAKLGIDRLLKAGVLISAVAAVAALAIVLAGWWQPIWLFAPWLVIAFGQGLALPNLTARAVAHAPHAAGAANGLLGFSQQMLSAVSIQLMSVAAAATATPVPAAAFSAASAVAAWLGLGLLAGMTRSAAAAAPR